MMSMDEIVENARKNASTSADIHLQQAAALPEELETSREFCREMAEPWNRWSEVLNQRNVGLLDSPMIQELETATLRALVSIESRLARLENSLLQPENGA